MISNEYCELAGRLGGMVTVAEPPFGMEETRTVPEEEVVSVPIWSLMVTVP